LLQGTPLVQSVRELFQYAVALLIFQDLDGRPQPAQLLLREAFCLTQAEARVAQALAGGRRLKAVASELGITHETVRAHLKAIFGKTGVNHQTELVIILDRMAGATGSGLIDVSG
jgi:DNA-binding CsgD family transcriptional regulator